MTRCPRRVEVEAAHDGRLDAAARASIAQHQRDCASCQLAANALAALRPALARLPVPSSDALAARRQRNRLLAAFEASPAAPVPSRGRGRVGKALGALALAGTAAAAMIATRAARAVDPPAVTTSAVTVAPTSARWSRYDQGGLTLVRLEDGELELHVAHGSAPHRLIVILPDGMLDDVGTTFHVSVAAGHTSAIAVRDGAVVMRRAGRPAVFLSAGDRWSPEPAPPPVASAAPSPPAVPPPAPRAPRVTRPPVRNAIAAEFRDAVSLLEGGRNAAAATALSGFLARHGDDPRAEDASYLLVLALQRIGDAGATRAAAHEYLQRYPRGLRRAEAEALVRGSP